MPDKNDVFQVLYVELGEASDKPFDGLAQGRWTDMYGREVELNAADFPDIVENTMGAIESTRTESGEIVGLPIDQKNHEKSAAAGWIVKAEMGGPGIIRLTPRWNSRGRELISGEEFRYFSATYSQAEKVILGGSLVNWPALTHSNGHRALRPIELSQSLMAVEEDAEAGAEANDLEFEETENGEESMNRDEIVELIREVVQDSSPEPQAQAENKGEALTVDLMNLIKSASGEEGMDGITESLASEFKKVYERIQDHAMQQAAAELARQNRESSIREFANRAVTGTAEAPRGLPVKQGELAKWMISLSDSQAEFARKMLDTILTAGLVEYREFGHSAEVEAKEPLPAEYASLLEDGTKTVAEFKSDPVIRDGLGDLSRYDLSKWE